MERHERQVTTIGPWGAFSDSYQATMPVVYRYLYRGTAGDVQLAEELTQATFEVAVRAFGQGRREALDPAWLHAVARSRLIDRYRRARREQVKLALVARRPKPDVDLPGEISVAEAHAALRALSAPRRLALVLRYLDDLTLGEVARLLGKRVRATEALLVRARAALRAAYEEQLMRAGDVRDLFESIEADPSAEFSDDLLDRLRAEYVTGSLDTNVDVEGPAVESVTIDVLPEEPEPGGAGVTERVTGQRRYLAVAAAAAATVLIAASVLVRGSDDGVEVGAPADRDVVPTTDLGRPDPSAPLADPAFSPPLPLGLTGLPTAAATPSTPETGQLVARLPMPLWVYEDGRVISARWTDPDHWTGFLEQRLTPEGVELVRAEILANGPATDSCRGGGPAGYGYSDGGRVVCEGKGPATAWSQGYPRLWELPYGERSWLPANAWVDPDPKPYIPARYAVWISLASSAPGYANLAPPTDVTAMLATFPPEVAELLGGATRCTFRFDLDWPPDDSACFALSVAEAHQIAFALGMTGQSEGGIAMSEWWGYLVTFLPYLPHDSPVWCCGG